MKAGKNKYHQKVKAEKAMRKVEATVSFDEGTVIIGEESYTECKKNGKN